MAPNQPKQPENSTSNATEANMADVTLASAVMTTAGLLPRDVAQKAIKMDLAKRVRLEDKSALQLQKLAKRHKNLRVAVAAELSERASRVARANALKKFLKSAASA